MGQASPAAVHVRLVQFKMRAVVGPLRSNKNPTISPSNRPAPLDCSNRKVSDAQEPRLNAQARCRRSTRRTAQYIVKNAQRVLSQLCKTRKRYGSAVRVMSPVTTIAAFREQTRRDRR